MKKNLIALMLMLLPFAGRSQSYELVSHLDGWNNTIFKCPARQCPTFDYLCLTGGGGCNSSPIYTGQFWNRIGTPHYGGPGFVGAHAQAEGVEGLYTNFNFVPGETYLIHVGINKYAISNNPYGNIQNASIKLFATNQLVQTNGNVCCTEPPLWDYPNNIFNGIINPPNIGYWADNNGQYNAAVEGIEIGEINPGISWAGTTKDFAVPFTAPSGTSYSQFAMHLYINAESDQVDALFDYIVIERQCGANFGYAINTNNVNDVHFSASSQSAAVYHWDFGDGVSGDFGPTPTHTYAAGSDNTHHVCLDIYDGEGNAICSTCKDICVNPPAVEGTCDELDIDFELGVFGGGPRMVGLTPDNFPPGGLDIDWGDGTGISGAMPASYNHEYNLASGYDVCVTIHGDNPPDCYLKKCLHICLPEFDGSSIDEAQAHGGHGDAGKPELTGVDANSLNGFSIKPNPVTSMMEINMAVEKDDQLEIVVYDITGKTVLSQKHHMQEGNNKFEMDMSQLSSGVYIVQLKTAGQTYQQKITKE